MEEATVAAELEDTAEAEEANREVEMEVVEVSRGNREIQTPQYSLETYRITKQSTTSNKCSAGRDSTPWVSDCCLTIRADQKVLHSLTSTHQKRQIKRAK